MSLENDYKRFQYERNLHKFFINTPLKEGETCIKFKGQIVVERQGNHPQPNHNIEVDVIEKNPFYLSTGGNTKGKYLAGFKKLYLTKHTRQVEKIPVPEIKEQTEIPSHVLAELMTNILPGITLGMFLDEVVIKIGERMQYENEIRKVKRKGKLK